MLQSGLRQREPRIKVLAPCYMNHRGVWAEACIHDVSSRGVLAASDKAPEAGAYVEVRRGSLVIIGRVVWRKGRFFGVRTQDRLSAQVLMGGPGRAGRAGMDGGVVRGGPGRGPHERLVAEGELARRVERGRRVRSLLQLGFLASAGAAAAVVIASESHRVLSRPLAAVEAALRE